MKRISRKECYVQSLLLGTHTSGNEQNYLMIAEVKIPLEENVTDPRKFDAQRSEIGGYGASSGGKIDIKLKINHEGEVNKARYMPQNPSVIATKSPSSDVLIFDYTNHPSVPNPDGKCNPEIRLKGHTKEGYGLSWNPRIAGYLISSSHDSKICLWDISQTPNNGNLDPLLIFESHNSPVGDVQWHHFHKNYFGSVGDDKIINLYVLLKFLNSLFIYIHCRWDSSLPSKKPIYSFIGHNSEINSLSFNPFNEYIFATASSDKQIGIWDFRNLNECLYRLKGHEDEIYNVEWSTLNETILASSGKDCRIHVWDISKIGENEIGKDCPELLFIHGGHTAQICDFNWNMNDEFVIASVDEDNILQIWQMSENIYGDDNENQTNYDVKKNMNEL